MGNIFLPELRRRQKMGLQFRFPGKPLSRFVLVMGATMVVLTTTIVKAQESHCGAVSTNGMGFDGVRANLEVVLTTTNPSPNVLVWCGMDWNATFWIQAGWWARSTGYRAYIEYVDDAGYPGRTEPGGPGQGGTYQIYQQNGLLYATIYGGVYGTYFWSSFDAYPMCRIYVGAEMRDSNQHTPGTTSNYCDITNVEARAYAFGSWYTPSLGQLNTAYCASVDVGIGSLSIWDQRALNQPNCP